MKRVDLVITVPENVDELDAQGLAATLCAMEVQGLEPDVVPMLLLVVAESLIRASTASLVDQEMPRLPRDAALNVTFSSARLRAVDELMHLPNADPILRIDSK